MQDQAGALQRIRRILEPIANRGEEMQLAKITGVLNRARRQRSLRIVGLVLQGGYPVNRRQEILGLGAAGGAADQGRMAKRLDPFLRCLHQLIGQALQSLERLALERVKAHQRNSVLQFVRRIVRRLQQL